MAKTNVAKRLNKFIALIVSGETGSADTGVWVKFANALGLPRDLDEAHKQRLVSIAIGRFYKDIELIKDRVAARQPDLGSAALEEPIDLLRQSFRQCSLNMSNQWTNIGKNAFNATVRTSVPLWGVIIGDDEEELPSVDLGTLRDALNDARSAVLADHEVDGRFRATMLDLLAELSDALDAYVIGGMEGVQRALRAFWAASTAAREKIKEHEHTSSVRAVWEAYLKLRPVLEVVLLADDFFKTVGASGPVFTGVARLLGFDVPEN